MHENPASHPGNRRHTPQTARAHLRTTPRQHLRPSPADTTALVAVTLAGQRHADAIQAGPMNPALIYVIVGRNAFGRGL
jgi:hypothetical protein